MKKLLFTSIVMMGLVTAISAQSKLARPSAGKKKPVTETMTEKRTRIATANKDKWNKKKKSTAPANLLKETTDADKKVKAAN
jgi:hypothetical protein